MFRSPLGYFIHSPDKVKGKCLLAPIAGVIMKCFVVHNVSKISRRASKMLHDSVRNWGKCFMALVNILWPDMQGKNKQPLNELGF